MTVTMENPRTTSTSTVTTRTSAATAARVRMAAERAALRLGLAQLDSLPDAHLVALVAALLGEVERRGLDLEVR